jgi:hypothetical protein
MGAFDGGDLSCWYGKYDGYRIMHFLYIMYRFLCKVIVDLGGNIREEMDLCEMRWWDELTFKKNINEKLL